MTIYDDHNHQKNPLYVCGAFYILRTELSYLCGMWEIQEQPNWNRIWTKVIDFTGCMLEPVLKTQYTDMLEGCHTQRVVFLCEKNNNNLKP